MKGHYKNASSIMFLLGISDILEEYTREKSRNTLSSALIFQVDKVWVQGENGEEYQKSLVDVQIDEKIIVRTGSMIPVDGDVVTGEAEVNEASMTGESLPVQKTIGDSVFAGTVLVDGEIVVSVKSLHSESRIQSILTLVEESEELKSTISSKATHLADRIVPYSFLFSGIVFALTGSTEKALSALTVDYSCAIKLATPLSVISAISEASNRRIMVKGGKYLETVSEADTIVFDKTGTLTMATPKVMKVLPFGEFTRDEALRLAACLEEHFPHSLARAIVKKAEEENLKHREEHAEVQYIVSHGVHSTWRDHKVLIGSAHFLKDDNSVYISPEEEKIIDTECLGYSCVYLSVDDRLAGVICVQDPPRPEAPRIISELKSLGIENVFMLTGDSSQAAEKIAEELSIDNVFSGVLPEDKAAKIEELQNKGHRVIMVGDGINDTPALAKADVSISLRDATDLAREVSDITLLDSNLDSLIELRKLSRGMTERIESNFTKIFAFNTMLLIFGATGTLQPTTTALLHNVSTALIGANSTRNILPLE
ncbi:cation transporter E1-E2 family ATPase [Chlamydia trachomatis]|nr:cation transporter E1-E2 family ATPase [Chlamydia trachomatis]